MIIDYQIRKSRRARRIGITVSHEGAVFATAPICADDTEIANFVEQKSGWISDKLLYFKKAQFIVLPKQSKIQYQEYKKDALILAIEKVLFWNRYYGLSFKDISIKNQKTRWGSCSRDKKLSFNYKIVFLTSELQDYLVVHELCHLSQFNHSKSFWSLVAKTMPDYKKLRLELKRYK